MSAPTIWWVVQIYQCNYNQGGNQVSKIVNDLQKWNILILQIKMVELARIKWDPVNVDKEWELINKKHKKDKP